MSDLIYVTNARLSFPALTEAKVSPLGGEPKFGADLLLPKGDDNFAKFMGEVGKLATTKWKENAQNVLSKMQAERKLRCYGDGAEKINAKTYKVYDGYEGMSYITTSSNADRPPMIMRADGSTVDNTMERQQLARNLYGGCYFNAAVRVWPQDNQFGRAIRCELVAIQFNGDGEPFGEGSPDVSGMFGAVNSEAKPSFM